MFQIWMLIILHFKGVCKGRGDVGDGSLNSMLEDPSSTSRIHILKNKTKKNDWAWWQAPVFAAVRREVETEVPRCLLANQASLPDNLQASD